MKTAIKSLPQLILIILFVYAAVSKVEAFTLFRISLYRQAFRHAFADVLLYLLPALELLTVVLLLSRKAFLAGLLLSLFLLSMFTGYIMLIILHWWKHVPCPCGGLLEHLSWPAHFLFNCFFIALNLVAIYIHVKERRSVT
jgi:putative oxidoreductase